MNKTDIPYIVYEGEMARSERNFKRLWITIVILIALLVATNTGWLVYESQFETVETTQIEAEQDGSGVNIVGGGDVNYGAESHDNQNSDESKEEQSERSVQTVPDV